MANIVIADDSIVMRTILQFMIEKCGHRVVGTAKDGEDAVRACKGQRPDAVLLDAVMKGTDGLVALQEIKRLGLSGKIIIVVEAGQVSEEAEAKQMGADGILRKPFVLQQVSDELIRILAS